MRGITLAFGFAIAATPVLAQTLIGDPFSNGANGAKVHVASGFVCPATIGHFQRDAASQSDVDTGTDFCGYAALDGVYGTIRLTPIDGGVYDPKASLADDFVAQERTGGKQASEKTIQIGSGKLPVFTRIYETTKLEDLHYHVLFAGAAVQNWAVEAIVEYASPREDAQAQAFLDAVYGTAEAQIAAK